jgi:hypothetical protein
MKDAALTIRLDPALERQFEEVAGASGRSKREVVRDALHRQLGDVAIDVLVSQVPAGFGKGEGSAAEAPRSGRAREGLPRHQCARAAVATRGLAADVVRLILAEHDLLTPEVVLLELERVLATKLELPKARISEYLAFLRAHEGPEAIARAGPRGAGPHRWLGSRECRGRAGGCARHWGSGPASARESLSHPVKPQRRRSTHRGRARCRPRSG